MESFEGSQHNLSWSNRSDVFDISGKLSSTTRASTPPMDRQQSPQTPTPYRGSSLPLPGRRLSRTINQQSALTPIRQRSCSPALDPDHRVSPSLVTIGSNRFIQVAYLLKASPVVKARLVQQQDFATRRAMDEKDIVINKLQEQVRKHIYHTKW